MESPAKRIGDGLQLRSDIETKPNSFVAFFEPRTRRELTSPSSVPLTFKTTVETDQYAITIHFGEREMLTMSADEQRLLILCGDIYRPQNADPGHALLDLYERIGPDFVKDLNGAFSFLLIDRSANLILMATDRVNSVKLLARWDGDTLIVSNSIDLQPIGGLKIDRTAVSTYLAAGFIYNNRTLFEAIEVLDRASTYRLHDGSLEQTRYWRMTFEPFDSPASEAILRKDLGDLLVESVRLRLRADRPTYLSLSAGEDARAILGILSALRVPDVSCFSYAYGPALPNSDESLSARLAAISGYRHELISSFDGDAVGTLARIARFSGGMALVCDEVDAWLTLGARVANAPAPVMFNGDTRFFRFDFDIRTPADATWGCYMPDFSVLSWLEKLIGTGTYREFLAATQSELAIAVNRIPPTDDGYELRDQLGLDQINNRLIGTWREHYSGRFFKQARPFLDNDILDLFARIPTRLRRGKRLYISTVTAMFPQLFALPRATSAGYTTYWTEAIRRQNTELRAFVEGQSSPLDDVVDPDILLALLASDDLAAITRSNALLTKAAKKAYRLVKRSRWRWTPFARPSLFRSAVSARTFLVRALVIRRALADMTAGP